MIAAVLFDLDDTLFDQRQWLAGAWLAVAEQGERYGLPRETLQATLESLAAEGSDRGHIIDRALAPLAPRPAPVRPLIEAFRQHVAPVLRPYPGVYEALPLLRARVAVGLVSDGDPHVQRGKLRSLGLGDAFDVVVWSDEYGRAHRKPDSLPFRLALAALEVPPRDAVFVGDRPDKDVEGARRVGMRAVRVRTGEWAHTPDIPPAWKSVPGVLDAITVVMQEASRPLTTMR